MQKIIKCLLLTTITLFGVKVSAQDIIVKKDGSIIKAKVLELSETTVLYKNFTNPQGPTYSMKIENIFSITYENGEQEKFSNSTSATTEYAIPENTEPATQANTEATTQTIKPSAQETNNLSNTILEAQIADLESRGNTITTIGKIATTVALLGTITAWVLLTDADGSLGNILIGTGIGMVVCIGGICLTNTIASPSYEKANNLRKSMNLTESKLSIQPVLMQNKLNGNLAGGVSLSLRF